MIRKALSGVLRQFAVLRNRWFVPLLRLLILNHVT